MSDPVNDTILVIILCVVFFAGLTLGNPKVEEEVEKYADFENIPEDRNAHNVAGLIEVLQIINKYSRASTNAEHDELYLHIDEEVSMEDAKRLYELAAFYDYEEDCWKKYV